MTSRSYSFKLVIVGDSGVGKSCLMSRFVDNTYTNDRTVTLGEYGAKTWAVDVDGTPVRLTILDTTGVKRMRPLVRTNFYYTDGFVVAYDCTNLESFKNVKEWMQDIDNYAPDNASKLLVSTKCDLVTEKKVDSRTAKEYADKLQIPFFVTSAKKATNVEQAFVTLARQIKNRMDFPLTVAHPAKRMKTEQRSIKRSNHSSTSQQESSNWSGKLKDGQENSTKIAGQWIQQMKEMVSEMTAIREKFTETADRLERLQNKEAAASVTSGIIGDNILCEACQRNVKVKLQECNIL